MERSDLQNRLERLGRTIDETRARMKREAHLFNGAAHLGADELKERYRLLQKRLQNEVADAEAHGHHVSDLEKSVRQWLDSIDERHLATTGKPAQKPKKDGQDV